MPNNVTWKLRYGIITYAQCGDLDPWKVVDMLAGLSAECIIGREHHEDGGIHLHCFVDFGRIFRSRRIDVFDVEGRHPNVQHVGRTPWVAYDYCLKEGDVVAGAAERPKERRAGLPKPDEVWVDIMAAETRDEFFYLCEQLAPRSLCLSFNSIAAFADWKYRVDPQPYQHPDGPQFSEEKVGVLHEWAQTNLGRRTGGTYLRGGVKWTPPGGAYPAGLISTAYPPRKLGCWGAGSSLPLHYANCYYRASEKPGAHWTYKSWKDTMGKVAREPRLFWRTFQLG